tara:strand:+ start:6822 stop:8117 length:1296 start_codon:yes stop_codon:yes gene_type:complete
LKISVFGLGYVGCVNVACLAKLGHTIIGVDINPKKIDQINNHRPTVSEPKLDKVMSDYKDSYYATANVKEAVDKSDVAILCINTPNNVKGNLDISILERCVKEISTPLSDKDSFFLIVVKSTVPPGTCNYLSNEISKLTSKVIDEDFSVVSIPEFLREGSAIDDFFDPPYTLVGSKSDKVRSLVEALNNGIAGKIIFADIKTAEFMKFVNNSFHALKVSFGNEIGLLSKELEIDSRELMKYFCLDKKLNISPYYFKPAFAYGGSCLPKDLLATNTLALDNGLNLPILSSISLSNNQLIDNLSNMIVNNYKTVGIVGLSFKSNTDDVRNSPIIKVIRNISGNNLKVSIYEKFIEGQLIGPNKSFIKDNIPNISDLLVTSINSLVQKSELIICFTDNSFVKELSGKYPDKTFLDLTVNKIEDLYSKNYVGLTW